MLQTGRRHVRLCGQMGANQYAEAIQPKLDALAAKEAERSAAVVNRQNAYDTVVLRDSLLDDEIRTAFDTVKMHDRKNGTLYAEMFFPKGFSDLTVAPLAEEPQQVNNLVVKLEGAGVAEFQPIVDSLRGQAAASLEAWAAYQTTVDAYNTIVASAIALKNAVREQYEHNWLNARLAHGSKYADRLFPKLDKQTEAEEEPVAPTPAA
jgi:hypothetical protein